LGPGIIRRPVGESQTAFVRIAPPEASGPAER